MGSRSRRVQGHTESHIGGETAVDVSDVLVEKVVVCHVESHLV